MKSKVMSGTSEVWDDPVARLLAIMAALRDPIGGCPWDLAQSFETIAPYTIEEAYEVADAIGRGDMGDLCDELGDLLLQVVYHARLAEEAGAFDFAAVAQAICEKMIRRHPHVFAAAERPSLERQGHAWEEIKAAERAAKPASELLDDIPFALPALTRALKLSSRAARVGFVWQSVNEVVEKLREEVEELDAELARGDRAKAAEELGRRSVQLRQHRPRARHRPGNRPARHQRQVRPPLCLHRNRPRRPRNHARQVDPR